MGNYLKDIEDKLLEKWKARKIRTSVALDGSSISDKAMEVAAGFNYAARSDKLHLLHIMDSTKPSVPRNLLPKTLRNKYEGDAMHYHVGVHFTFCETRWLESRFNSPLLVPNMLTKHASCIAFFRISSQSHRRNEFHLTYI